MYELPPLPYKFDALEPYIDAKTMEIHYTKHHQAYVNNLNQALENYPKWHNLSITELLSRLSELPPEIQTPVRNQGGGHYNHSFFWPILSPQKTQPSGELKDRIIAQYGTPDALKKELLSVALKRFGSGWAWLAIGQDDEFKIFSTANQDSPVLENLTPIIGVDVWEHAYYLQYQNRRNEYLEAWWQLLNWEQAMKNYDNRQHLEI